MKTKRSRWMVLYAVVAILLALELVARLTTNATPWLNPHYVTVSQQFAELDELIADADWGTGKAPKYYEEFLYSNTPRTTRHVTFTNYYSARLTPDSVPLPEAEHIVWTFGGSTMQNTETTDSLTIANTWAKMFNHSLGATHIKNFGVGAFFSSYELIKFQKLLREVSEQERPTVAIFYDGYNDAVFGFKYGAGQMQRDLSLKLQALVERRHLTLWTYALSELLARHSRLWDRTGKRLVDWGLFSPGEPSRDPASLNKAVGLYVSNVRMLQATCAAFEIRCLFILQPLILTKRPLAPLEQEVLQNLEAHPRMGTDGSQFVRTFYVNVAELLKDDATFIDASRILNGRSDPDFYDIGHVGALTPPIIGERTGTHILARLNAQADAK